MFSNYFTPSIVYPTRVVDNAQPSLLDNIFINTNKIEILSGNLSDKISDHMPNFLIIKNFEKMYKINPKIKKRDFKNFREEDFLSDLQDASILEKVSSEHDVNNKYNIFHDTFLKILNLHAPIRTLSQKEVKLLNKPWLSKGLLTSIKLKNKFYKKFLKTKDQLWYSSYKQYRDKINHLIRKSKVNHYKGYFLQYKSNSKKLWQGINSILNNKGLDRNANFSLQTPSGVFN